MSSFDRLLDQIDAFIRKYYKNKILKGLLLFVGVLLGTYLLVTGLEYFGRFGSWVRAFLFFGFLGLNGYILGRYIVIPILRLQKFGKRVNRYQAASIIGDFFPDVSDRLLNTLQLNDQLNTSSADYELLSASVQQRSATMSTLPFVDAINFGENKRYLKWVLPVVAVVFIVALMAPSLLTQGTSRVVNFNKEFAIPAPFTFSFLNDVREVEEGSNYPFEVELVGKNIPNKVYVKSNQGRSLLTRVTKTKFKGELKQVREETAIQFEASEFESDVYDIGLVGKTSLGKMQATLVYPSYLGREKEVIDNASDITCPEGTKIQWSVVTKNSAETTFEIGDRKESFTTKGFKVSDEFRNDASALVVLKNAQTSQLDSTFFEVDVIKDNYPSIQVSEVKDSLKDGVRFFSGVTMDDHGLAGLSFVYEITTKGAKRTERLNVGQVSGTESKFVFAVDFRKESLSLEDKIEYYFVVVDNDGVNGGKSARSRSFSYRLPTLEDLNDAREEEQEKTKKDLKDLTDKVDQFRENLSKLKNETRDNKSNNWNKQNQVQQLQEDHKSLLEDLESIQEDMNNSMEEKNQLSEIDEELLEQQEMINDLLEELMDDELRELLEQLEELMKQNDEEGVQEKMEDLEMNSEDMKKQLDRSMEMLKRLQVNEKIDDIEEELKKLAEEQDELREDTQGDKKISDVDKEKQEEISEKFEDLKEELEKLDSLNQELKSPMDLGDTKDEQKAISDDLKESSDQLQKDKGKKASESQQGASEKMKQMAEQMDMMQQQSNQEQQQEDMDMLRNILESLVTLSLDQENVMNRMRKVRDGDPAFKKYSRKQRRIVDDTRSVSDSLYALAERQPKIASFIDDELNQIHKNHDLALTNIDEFQDGKNRRALGVHQQYVMTSYNNLALMLNESLQQMQQQMQSMMQGSGQCNKPGGKGMGKSGNSMSPGDMKQMLKKQLEQMKKGEQEGNKPGGKKPGDKPGSNPGGTSAGEGLGLSSKQVAKMAAQQSAMRKKLEQMRRDLNSRGKGEGNKLNPLINELEKQERDLVNKRLGNNLVKRQRDILTRLLESEKALMERGFDEKRESKEGKNQVYGNQIRFDEYNKEKLRQIELLRSVDPAYRKYYKDRANEYFNRLM